MKKFFKNISLVLAVVFSFSFLISCGKEEAKQPAEIKTIQLNEVVRSIFYAPMYAAITNGFFEEEGLKIELSTGQGADKTMQQVLSKNADIGLCGPEQIVYLFNQGKEDHGKVFAQLTRKDGAFLVARDGENFSFDSLKGKTLIGGRPGGMPEMTLEHVLKQKGLVPGKDVEIITNLAFNATAGAFTSGTGDFISVFEPTASILEKEKAGKIVSSIGKEAGDIAYTCFFSTEAYIKENAKVIQGFTNAIYKGQKWVQSTPSSKVAESIIEFFPGSEVDVLTTIIDRYKEFEAFATTPEISKEGMKNLMDIIEGYDKTLIPNRPDFEKIVDESFSKESVKSIK